MLELAILGLLKERPMHGYELKKQLGQKLGFFWTVSFGSLYPTLKNLERRGVVVKLAPDELASRRKQAYRITETGEQEFLSLLEEGAQTSWEEEKFPLRLAFFGYLRPDIRIRLLERRRAFLEDKLDEGAHYLNRATRGKADSYTLSLMRHGMAATRHDIAWLDELITAERAALADERADEDLAASAGAAGPAVTSPGSPGAGTRRGGASPAEPPTAPGVPGGRDPAVPDRTATDAPASTDPSASARSAVRGLPAAAPGPAARATGAAPQAATRPYGATGVTGS